MRGWKQCSKAFSFAMREHEKAKYPGRVDVPAAGGGEGI
jgi:hypothetical protein